MGPHHFDADSDSIYHPEADTDSDFYLMPEFLLDADPDPTFYPDTNPDLDPSFQINDVPFLGSETGSNLLVRIRIRGSVPLTNGSLS